MQLISIKWVLCYMGTPSCFSVTLFKRGTTSATSCFEVNLINPIALRAAKTLWSFGCSECKRVNQEWVMIYGNSFMFLCYFYKGG